MSKIILILIILCLGATCEVFKNQSVQHKNHKSCPSISNVDSLTDQDFSERLVHPCRYDKIQLPKKFDENGKFLPIYVYARAYIYYLQNLDAHDSEYSIQLLLQLRYDDPRLRFDSIAPKRNHSIKGEGYLREKIWVPHIFFQNEKNSGVVGTYGKHIITAISPQGTVITSSRIQATLFCPMNFKKFPFDIQTCTTTLECWMYNTSQVKLHWEMHSPVTMSNDKIMNEYSLINTFTNEVLIQSDHDNLRHGSFKGNYSSISFSFTLKRDSEFYVLEYYIPSAMIVAVSWVSFWLQADQTAPRAMLGTSSMLSFITLTASQNKILPKVSSFTASEIWSMTCTFFIFASLMEFLFANIIWRRKKDVELKKVNVKNILKHTLLNHKLRELLGVHSSRGLESSDEENEKKHSNGLISKKSNQNCSTNNFGKMRVQIESKVTEDLCDICIDREDLCSNNDSEMRDLTLKISSGKINENHNGITQLNSVSFEIEDNSLNGGDQSIFEGWTKMTSKEIAYWIDRRSRIFFPFAFVTFNIFYWTFIYWL